PPPAAPRTAAAARPAPPPAPARRRPRAGRPARPRPRRAAETAGTSSMARPAKHPLRDAALAQHANQARGHHGHSGGLGIFGHMSHSTNHPTAPRAPRHPFLLLPLLLLAAAAGHAQPAGTTTDPALKTALAAAQRGQLGQAQAGSLPGDPRWPWLEATRLSPDLDAAADALRERWLAALARRQDWSGLLADRRPQTDAGLRCARLNALQALGRTDAGWTTEAQALWRTGKSMPDACDPVFATLASRGGLDDALRWERFDLALAESDPAVMRAAASGLPAAARALAEDYAA